jgi:PKD domain-containing protein
VKHLRALALAAALLTTYPASGLPGVGSLHSSATNSPGYPAAGQPVTFTVAASDADGAVSNVVLCFGDGSCEAESYTWDEQERLNACVFGSNYILRFRHTYTRGGLYPVSLVVKTIGCSWMAPERQQSEYNISVG